MRRRLLTLAAAVLLPAGAALAQTGDARWRWVAPEDEEFSVLMPGVAQWEYRTLPLAEGLSEEVVSYEAARGGVSYSVLAFNKHDLPFKTLDALVKSFSHALLGAENGDFLIEFERDVPLDGRVGKQFVLKTGKPLGTVRVYEAEENFYVLMTSGGRAGEPEVDRFFSSFRLGGGGGEEVVVTGQSAVAPARTPLWPAAPRSTSVGVIINERAPDVTAAPPGGRAPVSGGIINSKVISRVEPTYPPIAKAARAQGTVVVQITVDEDGKVISAHAVSGHPLLRHAAVSAVREWRFSPTLLEGQPVKVTGTVTVNFKLGEGPPPPPTRDF